MHGVPALLTEYGILIVFLNVLLDQGGLPIPAIPTLLAAAALEGRFDTRIALILIAGAAGALIADIVWFQVGKRHGRRVLGMLCRISISPDSCVSQTESLFGNLGPWALPIAKFVPGMTNITVALAGTARMPTALFLFVDGLGALAFVGVPLIVGVIFKNAITAVLATLTQLGVVGIATVALVLSFYLAMRWMQRYIFIRQLRMDRITVGELVDLMKDGKPLLVLDVRAMDVRAREGMIPGSIPAHPSDLHPIVAAYPRDLEIIVYCACPNEASAAKAAKHLKKAGFKKIRPLIGGVTAWIAAGHPVETLTFAA
ncbi:MAG: sulfurtransferase [Alphaproteobacteria bacterium]|nr:sulfurtransferase [Alphaproteobacteria bacterium]MDE2496068.1 sulfurtransferase [Alphaproteobacteria bacterium]